MWSESKYIRLLNNIFIQIVSAYDSFNICNICQFFINNTFHGLIKDDWPFN